MAIKGFRGATLQQAQQSIRDAVAGDPLILAVRDLGADGVELLCKVDPPSQADSQSQRLQERLTPEQYTRIVKVLAWHGVSQEMTEYILDQIDALPAQIHKQDPQRALEAALLRLLPFSSDSDDPQTEQPPHQVFVLLGPPGQGKTSIAVKLALAAKLGKLSTALIAADSVRLGAEQQLRSYAAKVACPVFPLAELETATKAHRLCLIDTPAVNPFNQAELDATAALLARCQQLPAQVTPALVLGTYINSNSAAELVSCFSGIGVRNMIATFQDIERRLGAIIELVWRLQVRLFAYSPQPEIAHGLKLMSADGLAALLFRHIPERPPVFASAPKVPKPASDQGPTPEPAQKPTPEPAQKPTPEPRPTTVQDTAPSPTVATEATSVSEIPTPPITPSPAPGNMGQIIILASGKGGVGKTFLSIQLAIATATRERRVLLFDGDLGLANIDIQLNLKAERDIVDVIRQGHALKDVISRGAFAQVDVLAGRSGSTSLAGLPSGEVVRIGNALTQLSHDYDQVFVDLGAGIDRPVQLLAALAHDVVVVVNDEPTSLADAYALIKILYRQSPTQRRHVLVTQVSSERVGGKIFQTLKQTCHDFLGYDLTLLGIITQDALVSESIRKRMPLVRLAPDSPLWKRIRQIAAHLDPVSATP